MDLGGFGEGCQCCYIGFCLGVGQVQVGGFVECYEVLLQCNGYYFVQFGLCIFQGQFVFVQVEIVYCQQVEGYGQGFFCVEYQWWEFEIGYQVVIVMVFVFC